MLTYPLSVRFRDQRFIITKLCTRLAWRGEFVSREDFHLCGQKAAQLTQALTKLPVLELKVTKDQK